MKSREFLQVAFLFLFIFIIILSFAKYILLLKMHHQKAKTTVMEPGSVSTLQTHTGQEFLLQYLQEYLWVPYKEHCLIWLVQ